MSNALARLAKTAAGMPAVKKTARSHNGLYTDLPSLLAHVTPQLEANGLGAVCEVTSDPEHGVGVRYIFVGRDDRHETPWLWMGRAKDAQQLGGLITYGRRYVLSAACGVPEAETVEHENKPAKGRKSASAPAVTAVRQLQIAMSNAGIGGREERLNWVIEQIGRTVGSSKDLTGDEIKQLLEKLPTAKTE